MAVACCKISVNIVHILLIIFSFCIFAAEPGFADPAKYPASSEFHVEPHSLSDGSLITLIAPMQWAKIGDNLSKTLISTHNQLSKQLGGISALDTYVRIMPEKSFFNLTGAPEWTNALYYKRQIYIPVNKEKIEDSENLSRSAKHEYVHAVFNSLSAGRCPGWLDEGLAQWVEGDENPALRPSLIKYLKKNQPIRLQELQSGFTKLPSEQVAAAYAQSLVISLMLKQSYGLKSIKSYLEKLSLGAGSSDAFYDAFGISEQHFENMIQADLLEWTHSIKD